MSSENKRKQKDVHMHVFFYKKTPAMPGDSYYSEKWFAFTD